jgi:RNA polymerase sigma factor (sigma-70 family)
MLAAISTTTMSRNPVGKSRTRQRSLTNDSHPPLPSPIEEHRLAERIKSGDRLAQQQLVLAHRRLVFHLVGQYKTPGSLRDDLVQEGFVGLIRAAQNFDPSTHAIRFASYATIWIHAFVNRAITSDRSLVRLPKHTRRLRKRYLQALDKLKGQSELPTELASQASASQSFIADHSSPQSANHSQGADGSGLSLRQIERARKESGNRTLCASLAGSLAEARTAETEPAMQEERTAVQAALCRLNPFEAWVIRERYGVGDWRANSLDPGKAKKKAAVHGGARKRRRQRSRAAGAGRSAPYYWRTHEMLSRDCGLSVHRLRLVEKAALDKLRSILDAAPAPVASDHTKAMVREGNASVESA